MQELLYSVDGVGAHGPALTLLQPLTPLQPTHTLSEHSDVPWSRRHGVKVITQVLV